VFGMSFSELCVLVIVGIVIFGPKDLPRILRKAGQLAGKVRRMASDVRAQSGIDDILRTEGLTKDIAEIRRLAQGDFIEPLRPRNLLSDAATSEAKGAPVPLPSVAEELVVVREREYPREGADSYKAIPDTAIVYAQGLPRSPLENDPLYRTGDADGVIPPPEPEPAPAPLESPPAAAPPEETRAASATEAGGPA
jgi:sec-independent protein translocase protein TatB